MMLDEGRGRFVHANGDVYEGQWLDDKACPVFDGKSWTNLIKETM